MTPESTSAMYFLFLVGLAGIGAACSGYRAYGRDAFRQRCFELRSELFAYAASGRVSFNDPAYGRLRFLMNATIRFSHRMNFGELILPILVSEIVRRPDHDAIPEGTYGRWRDALNRVPEDVQKDLLRFHERFGELIFGHALKYSPLAWPLFMMLAFRTNSAALDAVKQEAPIRVEECATIDADPEWLNEQAMAL